MDKFVLGGEQNIALKLMIGFINSDKSVFTLSGYAGTGKTYLVKALIAYLESNDISYELCTPTHKAKTVLERFTEREGMTLHKLLSLSPNIQILKLDLNYLKFLVNKKSMLFPMDGVVIIDEASMVNDELFELLLEKSELFNTKLIFIGDKAQLRPVKAVTHSKVFSVKDTFTLKKIYRQKEESGLTTVLPILRTKTIAKFEEAIGTEGSLYCYNNVKELLEKSVPYFLKALKNKDIMEAKFLAYTNNRVNAFNNKMESILFKGEQEYNNTGLLTAYDNIKFNKFNFWNSMDYVIVNDPVKIDMHIPGFAILPGYRMKLYDSSNKTIGNLSILSKEINPDYFMSLAKFIDDIRAEAVLLKDRGHNYGANIKWKQYYQIMESFTTPIDLYYDNRSIRKKSFDRGYAISVHKSQGSSINNVFIDMKNISQCTDKQEFRQLQYVSLSRTNINAHILQ